MFSFRRVSTGVAATLAIGLGVGVLGPLIAMLIPKYDDRGCSQVAHQIHAAASCAAFPELWKRWEEIAKVYGEEFSCPTDLERAVGLGLSISELRKIGRWTAQNRPPDRNEIITYEHVYDYWRKVGISAQRDRSFR